jgi:ribose-phosphate pyrophosphokinase
MAYSKRPVLLSGSSHPELGLALARALDLPPVDCLIESFPDGERHVQVKEDLTGRQALVLQTGAPPIGEHLLELSLLADACRRAGASEVVAVIPYFPYSRQDRRKHRGEPIGVRVVANLLAAMQLSRAITFDLHSAVTEASLPFPTLELCAVPLLARAVSERSTQGAVVVGPDLGASKLVQRYAQELGAPMAMVHKTRISGAEVVAERVIGDVRGLRPILVDDIIASGGTMLAAATALLEAGCRPELTVVATHAVLAGPALEQLARLPIERLVVSNTLPLRGPFPFEVVQVDVAPTIATAITRG